MLQAGLTRASPASSSGRSAASRSDSPRAHRQPADDHGVGARPELPEGAVHLGVPVLPAGAVHLLPGRAVAGEPGHLDGVAARRQRLRPGPQRVGRAGEAVHEQDAQRAPAGRVGPGGEGERGGVRQDRRHGGHSAPRAHDGRSPSAVRDGVVRSGCSPPGGLLFGSGGRAGTDATTAERAGRRGVLLVPEVGGHRPPAPDHLPTRRRGRGERARGGPGDPRQQPPVVRRLAVHAADADAPGHLRGQGGVLQQPRPEGLVPAQVLLRRRARSRSTAPAPRPPRARCRRRAGSSRRETCSGSTPRARGPTTAASTAARPAWRDSRWRPRCR